MIPLSRKKGEEAESNRGRCSLNGRGGRQARAPSYLNMEEVVESDGWRLAEGKGADGLLSSRIYSLVLLLSVPLYSNSMSIRKGGGEWMPMLLPVEGRQCAVCKDGLYRDTTMLRGGWSRCTVCDEFVHYGCLASGKVSFLKARPRVCKACRAAQDGTAPPSPTGKTEMPTAVGS